MDIKPMVGAAVGALIGAVIWAGITIVTGYEVGIVAWGIGGLVGFCAAMLGGRGTVIGVPCALLALASIFAGKMYAVEWSIEAELDAYIAESYSPEGFEEVKQEASLFAMLSEDEYPEFMLEYGYTIATDVDAITPEEMGEFNIWIVPAIHEFNSDTPSYENWRETGVADTRAVVEEEISMAGMVIDDLTPIDLIFAFLGIGTAYQLGAKGRHRKEEIVEDMSA